MLGKVGKAHKAHLRKVLRECRAKTLVAIFASGAALEVGGTIEVIKALVLTERIAEEKPLVGLSLTSDAVVDHLMSIESAPFVVPVVVV